MTQSKYFFCYSPTLHKYIQSNYKIRYVCAAKNEHDDRKFWLYEQSELLGNALSEYKKIFKNAND